MNKIINILFSIVISLQSCTNKEILSQPITIELEELNYNINKDYLAKIEGIQCNDSSLISFDFHSGESYTLFDLQTCKLIGRFGEIGDGPGEIPLGCFGNLINNEFYIHDLSTGLIAKYDMDSITNHINYKPIKLTRYDFPFSLIHFSKVVPLNDSIYFGAGLYSNKYQYTLFDKKNKIIDYNIDVYNANNKEFNVYHKMISNEGTLRKHPTLNKFVYFINRSSNIDFIEIIDNKIIPIKLKRDKNPESKPIINGSIVRVQPELHCEIGYIDLAVGVNNIYALYTDKDITNPYCSKIIRVFDWNGNFTKQYKLNKNAYYITVNEKRNIIYTAFRDEDDGWDITSYKIKE